MHVHTVLTRDSLLFSAFVFVTRASLLVSIVFVFLPIFVVQVERLVQCVFVSRLSPVRSYSKFEVIGPCPIYKISYDSLAIFLG